MTALDTLKDLILLQQAVDEVFSDLVKAGKGLETIEHLSLGGHHWDPAKHPRGWHGYFIHGIDSVPPGYHKPKNDAEYKRRVEDRADVPNAPKVHRALVIADDPDNPVQWKARANPNPKSAYPQGKWIEGRTTGHTQSAQADKFVRVDKLISSKLHDKIGQEIHKRLAKPDQFPTIQHVDSKGKVTNSARSPETVRDTAAVLAILHHMGMRVGSATGEKRGAVTSYGAVSLQHNHVRIVTLRGQKAVEFEFTSKGGKEIGPATKTDAKGNPKTPLYITDPKMVKLIEDTLQRGKADGVHPSSRLFPNTTDRLTADLLHEVGGSIDGQPVKQHDLRTAAATRLAAHLVDQAKPNITKDTTQAEADAAWKQIVEHVASMLTDTSKEAENSYISTSVKHEWDRITKNVKPTPVTARQAAGARRARGATGSGGKPSAAKAPGLGQKATGVPGKKQQGPGAKGRTPISPPSTPKVPAAPLPTLLGREKKLMDAITGYDVDIRHMQQTDPHAFRAAILSVQQKRAKAIEQLNQVRKLIGKSAPFSDQVNAVDVPIGVMDMRLVLPMKKRKKWKDMMDAKSPRGMSRQAFLNETVVYKRFFSTKTRKRHAAAGNALPDGSYPMPDADAVRRAAVLAQSKHGNWQAALKLIRRRSKELGIASPLATAMAKSMRMPKGSPARHGGRYMSSRPRHHVMDMRSGNAQHSVWDWTAGKRK